MKTEAEINTELDAIANEISRAKIKLRKGEMSKEVYISIVRQNQYMRLALKWVLGENERYD
jgi:hypothetical protein